jgi:hypothetical protein
LLLLSGERERVHGSLVSLIYVLSASLNRAGG